MYNFKNIFRFNKVVSILFLILTSFLCCLINTPLTNIQEAKQSLNESSFTQAGYLNYMTDDKNTYYIEMTIVYAEREEDVIMADIMMTSDMTTYGDIYFTKLDGQEISDNSLSSNECALSKSVMKEYNLSIGDQISIHSNFIDYNYQIKYCFDNYYGIHHIDFHNQNGLIILGENKQILDRLSNYNVFTFSDESRLFSSKGEIFLKKKATMNLNNIVIYHCLFTSSIVFVITVLIDIVSSGLKKDLQTYKYYGYKRSQLVLYMFIDSFMKYGLLMGITTLITLLYGLIAGSLGVYIFIFEAILFALLYITSLIIQLIKCRDILKTKK